MTLQLAPPPRHASPRRTRSRGRRIGRFDLKGMPYLLVSPYFLLFAIFGVFPLLYTLWLSLYDAELAGKREFAGFANYIELIADEEFWNAVVNTVGMFVLATVPQLLMALLLANALNKRLRGRLLLRLGVLLPMVTSVVAVAVVFSQLYSRDYGLINWVLGLVGVDPIA